MKSFIKKWYPLFLILILALALRIYLLINRGTFWFDENFSIHFSSIASWTETIKYWVLETNPPLYTFFLRFYLSFINENNETLVRLPSLVFSTASIILLYIFAQKMFSRRAAITSATLLSISTLSLFISVEARVYSLLTFLTILSFYLFQKLAFDGKLNTYGNNKQWILYFFVNLFLLYAHLTGAVVLICQFIMLAAVKTRREKFWSWFKMNLLAVGFYLVWLVPSVLNKMNLKLGTAWYFETNGDILNLLFAPIFNTIISGFQETLFFIVFIIIMYLLIRDISGEKHKDRKALILVSIWALLPPVLSAFLGVFVLKYIVIAYPALYLFYSYFLDKYVASNKLFALIFAVILLISLPHTYLLVSKPIFSWRDITGYIEANENETTVTMVPFMEALSFNKYYKGNRPVIGVYMYDDNLSLEERIVRYNWNLLETTDEHLQAWLFTNIERECATKVFSIHPSDTFERLDETFLENGWTLDEVQKPYGLSLNNLYIFNAPANYTTSSTCR
ncbi:MAG: hypothetical protein A2469_03210 [Candidatus Magasanikbacteria bacterium RIFOXYC2_FULL_40_16]|uniref:Glycosyltransferase RgtA/B/C/D-like domain-containing protein n=2 Tax=Candidatus Magasanikiibacteriota TaxID=1752731 RepID=A0A1F6NE75_9BACT|nr:MAG: hypothetical protein A2373_00840 [Candidatus Magasanikbacteria bacterium RIFOXYB1_FULL_40_15]OGH85981.1 MAG: hypothetical protein A2301_03045 [Candidatus Magasanikbacteria bacterium RIFOXYB2_FULL_40_13]OGH89988.1 MAG: hypothetical protein A2469_03210 [Candidatus Magasanikbacteria bacterium RIFOXYC2_FULL_40_16]